MPTVPTSLTISSSPIPILQKYCAWLAATERSEVDGSTRTIVRHSGRECNNKPKSTQAWWGKPHLTVVGAFFFGGLRYVFSLLKGGIPSRRSRKGWLIVGEPSLCSAALRRRDATHFSPNTYELRAHPAASSPVAFLSILRIRDDVGPGRRSGRLCRFCRSHRDRCVPFRSVSSDV